jgi:ubiquinone/menaquinone biosynthesis C-methylase UbiE
MFDFSKIADDYDAYYETPIGKMIDRLEKAAVDRLLPMGCSGRRLLEIGSGTGHWSAHFALRGYRVTGIDVSPDMVRVARDKGIENAEFHVGDLYSTGFTSGVFDVGVAITVLEFLLDPASALRELTRVVKPSGLLIIGALHQDSFLGRQRLASPHPIYTPAHFFTISQLESLLTRSGKVEIHPCLFAPPVESAVGKADKIEAMGLDRSWRHGNFLVAKVTLGSPGL